MRPNLQMPMWAKFQFLDLLESILLKSKKRFK